MTDEPNLQGGEYIAPNASPAAQKFILLARGLMYSDGLHDALNKAIHGGEYLADGGVPFLSHIVDGLQKKLGELDPTDLHTVVVHLAGSFVDLAEKLGDPDTKDKRAAVQDIVEGVMAVLSGELDQAMQQGREGGQQGMPAGAPEGMGAPPQGPPPLLESARGG